MVIWEYAKVHRFAFLTKDKDYASQSIIWGAPPKCDPAADRQLLHRDNRAHCPGKRYSIRRFRKRYETQSTHFEVAHQHGEQQHAGTEQQMFSHGPVSNYRG